MNAKKKLVLLTLIVAGMTLVFYYVIAIKWAEGMKEIAAEYVHISSGLSDTISTQLDSTATIIERKIQSLAQKELDSNPSN